LKNLFKNIQTLLIVVLIIIILFLRNCSGEVVKPDNPTVITKIETKWDTIREKVPTYVPKWKDRIVYEPSDTVYIDTNKVLEDYFADYYYRDSVYNDSIKIIIEDTISQNKIKSRDISLQILYPTITITRDSIVNERGFYAGIGVGGSKSQLNYVGGEFLYKSRKRNAFGGGIGVNENFQPILTGRLYWKLGK